MRIAAYNIRKIYGVGGAFSRKHINALNGINVKIKENEIVSLVGENGSGKTTLGLILSLLIKPDQGVIFFDVPDWIINRYETALLRQDNDAIKEIEGTYSVLAKDESDMRELRRKIGVVFQDASSSLDERMQAKDIISEPMLANGMSRNQANEKINELKQEVGIPDELLERYPYELSDGERQRVSIARALSLDPKFIFFDEPTSNLDTINRRTILDTLKQISSKHKTSILMSTHNIANANYISNKTIVMFRGDIVESGPTKEIINNPRHPYTKELISIATRRFDFQEVYIERQYNSEIKGCPYHRICPMSFEICGWTADEVADDLERLLRIADIKYSVTKGDNKVIINNVSQDKLREIINNYKKRFRSLYAIKSIKETNNKLELEISQYKDVSLYSLNDVEVKCHLFENDVSKLI